MLAKERRIDIVNTVIKTKIIHVHELAQKYSVSEMTIRRDLASLEKDGLIKRTHGGAIFNEEFSEIIDYNMKTKENKSTKIKLAEYAASLIKDGDIIAINTSTVCSEIAPFIIDKNITVVTNALDVTNILSYSKTINLITTGGVYVKKYRSFEGTQTIKTFESFNFDISFIGTNGINQNGIHTGGSLEAKAKKTLIKNSKKTYILAEKHKFKLEGQHKIADFAEVTIITNEFDLKDAPKYKHISFFSV